MNRLIAFGGVAIAAATAFQCLPEELRHRLTAAMGHRMTNRMKKMMANLPDDELRAQNAQIIALLQEQNKFLRERQPTARSERHSYG
jgi:hypothetical protein